MLTREVMFTQIDSEDVELIWEPVSVEYDNFLQMPVSFQYRAKCYEVLELIGVFQDSPDDPSLTYLVRTNEGVYALYLMLSDEPPSGHLRRVRWILHFQVKEEEEEGMLVDMKLKRVADFHGHLCPNLVIGYRACQYALDTLRLERLWQPGMHVIAENRTSALDAAQILTGCTVGNGRLHVFDHGKHVYTFVHDGRHGLRLVLRPDCLTPQDGFLLLERKVVEGTASLSETARYWAIVNGYVSTLLDLPNEILFSSERVILQPQNIYEGSSALSKCSRCGDLVTSSCLVTVGEEQLCPPCARAGMKGG